MSFRALVVRCVDADTVDVTATLRLRVANVDAPELGTEAGEAAKAYLQALLPAGSVVQVTPKSEDPHGRVVAHVYLDVGERLVADGHARRWNESGGVPR